MRILLVKLSSLGDVVQTLPVLSDILRAQPQAQMDWVVEESFASLLQSVPAIERVLVYAQRRWRKRPFDARVRSEQRSFRQSLHQCTYDVVLDAQGQAVAGHRRKGELAAVGPGRDEGRRKTHPAGRSRSWSVRSARPTPTNNNDD
jgi:heptosyltransferase-1